MAAVAADARVKPAGGQVAGAVVAQPGTNHAPAAPELPGLCCWLDLEPRDGAWHMAWDQTLLEAVAGPWLRVYRWPREEVTFGYFMRWAEVEPRLQGRPATRRWTGGGLVEHGADWTFSLMIPRACLSADWSPRTSYRWLHRHLLEALRKMGAAAGGLTLADRDTAASPGGACFERPVAADLMAGGRKVAGGAQRRGRLGLLHQGSLQWPALTSAWVAHFAGSLAREVEWVGGSDGAPVTPAAAAPAGMMPSPMATATIPAAWHTRARELTVERYACHSWTRAR